MNTQERIPSYLIKAEAFNILGGKTKIPGVTTTDKCAAVLDKYNRSKKRRYPFKHNMCNGKGYLVMDDGKVFYDNDNKRQVYSSWLRTCDCVNKIVYNDSQLKDILLG